MALRISKACLIGLVGLWGLIGGIQNLTQISIGYDSVATVFNPTDVSGLADWQLIQSPLILWIAWAVIPLSKFFGSAYCFLGARAMLQARSLGADTFNQSKSLALVGCSIMLAMLFGGFIVAAETYFQLWQTDLGNLALPMAFRYIGCIALIAIFVQQSDH